MKEKRKVSKDLVVLDDFSFWRRIAWIAWKRLAESIYKDFPWNEVPNVKQVPNEVPNSKQVPNEVPNEVPSLKQVLST